MTTLRVPFFLVANSKVDTEDALLFVSGYGTNVGVIAQLVVWKASAICDAAVHNSAVTGAVPSGSVRVFPHNDLDQLEEDLLFQPKQSSARRSWSGLASMDGDDPDLPFY